MQKSFLILPLFLLSFFSLFIITVSQADQRVSAIQNMLKNQGYDVGVIDGIAGKNTLREIKNWQFLNGYSESGKIDKNQINVLRQQSSIGKKLNKEEIDKIKERNKIEESSDFKFIDYFLLAGLFLGFFGLVSIFSNLGGEKDKRFKTGRKDNDEGDSEEFGRGCIGVIIAAVLLFIWGYFST